MEDVKTIIIKEIQISNFKSQNLTLSFGKNANNISGRNGIGKSTIMKAWNWLLTGYTDADSNPNSDLFDNRQPLSENTPVASVKATILINGIPHEIERDARAKFTRHKGSDVYSKATSDEYTYKVDNIDMPSKEFDAWLSENICDNKYIKYITNGNFFVNLVENNKKDARLLLFSLIGDVTFEDLRGNYPFVMQNKDTMTLEQMAVQATNNAKDIKERLNKIPTLIDDKTAEKARYDETDFNAIEIKINETRNEISDIDKTILGISETTAPVIKSINDAKSRRRDVENRIERCKREHESKYNNSLNDENLKLEKIKRDNEKVDITNAKNKSIIAMHENSIKELKEKYDKKSIEIEKLKNEFYAEKSKEFSDDTCAYCGQTLPDDKLEQAKTKFNDAKFNRLTELKNEKDTILNNLKAIQDQIDEHQAIIDKGFDELTKKDTSALEAEINAFIENKVDFIDTDQYKQLKAELESIVIPEIPETNANELTEKKKSAMAELETLNQSYGYKKKSDELGEAIKKLEQERFDKGAMLAECEKHCKEVSDCKQEMMEILSQRVNSLLEYAKIEVFSTQKNGTIIPDIILKDKNHVNYATTNGASRLSIVADVQRFFCNKLNVNMPCFVDESSIMNTCNLPKFDTQMFYLFCTEGDNLSVESF